MRKKLPENLTVAEVYELVNTLHRIMEADESGYACRFCAKKDGGAVCCVDGCFPIWGGLVEKEET